MNHSYWEQEIFTGSIDVAVIGEGIVGLSAAIRLKTERPELRVVVLEQGVILSGASLRNAGFACFGSPTELLADLENSSAEKVFTLVQERWKGLEQLRKLLGDSAIEFETTGGHEVFDDEQIFESCVKKLPEFNRYLQDITGIKETYTINDEKLGSLGFKGFTHLIKIEVEAQVNTGKMMQAFILKAINLGIIILNGIKLTGFRDYGNYVGLTTTWDTITAKRLLFATNGYSSALLKSLNVMPARAQTLITSPVEGLKVKGNFHFDRGYYFFRNVGNRLLLGGGRNLDFENETTTELEVTGKIQAALEKILFLRILPHSNYTIETRWSGIMGLGDIKVPVVDKLSDNVFCAVRMGGMGVALGTGTGQKAAGLVLNSL